MEIVLAYTALALSFTALAVSVICLRKDKKVVEYRPDRQTLATLVKIEKEIEALKEVVQVKPR